jgi:hypothetical protein
VFVVNQQSSARGADGLAVNASANLPANSVHFAEHAKAIARYTDLSGRIVIPTHRDFAQTQTREICDVQQLNVKPKAVDC